MISQSLSTSAIPGKPGALSGHLGGPVTRRGVERTDINYKLQGGAIEFTSASPMPEGTSSTTEAHFPADGFLSFAMADATRSA